MQDLPTSAQLAPAPSASDLPKTERIRHELRRRTLKISAREMVTPQMLRLTLSGPELEGFTSLSPADHIKIIVPGEGGEDAMRDYTPRGYDPQTQSLTIDFALHDEGAATLWAKQAQVGDTARIAGPRGSKVISGPIRNWLLIGDESALPSISRRIEELPAGSRVTSLVAVQSAREEQRLVTEATHVALWVHRSDPCDATALAERLAQIILPEGTYVWLAAEASVVKRLREQLIARGLPLPWLTASGYWSAGQVDGGEQEF